MSSFIKGILEEQEDEHTFELTVVKENLKISY
jgi:hypothetical protein